LLKGITLTTLLSVGTRLSLGSSERDLVGAMRVSTQQMLRMPATKSPRATSTCSRR
jgi:hypothetical protein